LSKLSLNIAKIKKVKKLGVPGIIAAVVLAFLLFLVVLYNTNVGMADGIGIQEPSFTSVDLSLVPPPVLADAENMADKLVGVNGTRHQSIIDQLAGSYLTAKEADIVIFFNSGGMGWNLISNTPGWEAILKGMTEEIKTLGYRPLVLNYSRTSRSFWGNIKEVIEAATRYPRKTIDMEQRVEFLANHLPDLKIIVAGESTGDVITEESMVYFRDNPSIYSLQTGCPFWYKSVPQPRTLRITSNGFGVDTFAYGNIPSMIWCTFRGWFGLESPEENAGNVLKSFRAPGHDYTWQYESIRSEIVGFLEDNFPKKN
jgi:hypothetical protein